jgi:hypothetical protein
MASLTSSHKGAAAEAEVVAAAIGLGLVVLRPLCEGGRYDLAIDIGNKILRVQCKWASHRAGVLSTRCVTSRHTPAGYRRSTYSASEVDAIALYSAATDACYLVPIQEAEGCKELSLRLKPTRNNQSRRVRWASDYELGPSLERNRLVSLEGSPDQRDQSER